MESMELKILSLETQLQAEREKLRIAVEALEFAINKYESHHEAYSEDIFPDDGRKPCQTTAGRMGRHMIKCFDEYLAPAREALRRIRG